MRIEIWLRGVSSGLIFRTLARSRGRLRRLLLCLHCHRRHIRPHPCRIRTCLQPRLLQKPPPPRATRSPSLILISSQHPWAALRKFACSLRLALCMQLTPHQVRHSAASPCQVPAGRKFCLLIPDTPSAEDRRVSRHSQLWREHENVPQRVLSLFLSLLSALSLSLSPERVAAVAA